MKQYASVIGSFIANTSIKLGSSPMRTLALAGYGLTTITTLTLQISHKFGLN